MATTLTRIQGWRWRTPMPTTPLTMRLGLERAGQLITIPSMTISKPFSPDCCVWWNTCLLFVCYDVVFSTFFSFHSFPICSISCKNSETTGRDFQPKYKVIITSLYSAYIHGQYDLFENMQQRKFIERLILKNSSFFLEHSTPLCTYLDYQISLQNNSANSISFSYEIWQLWISKLETCVYETSYQYKSSYNT